MVMVLLAAAAALSCTPDEDFDSSLSGSWQLTGWNGASPSGMEVYMVLRDDRSFTLYQKYNTLGFVRYDGTFTVDGSRISGIYSDGKAWVSGYTYTVNGNTLTMVSEVSPDTGLSETSVYTRHELPETITGGNFENFI